jgi:2-aminoadipate transaminase
MRSLEKGRLAYSRMGNQITDPVITQLMVEALSKPDLLSLAAGFTDNHVLPVNLVNKVVTNLSASTENSEYLQYGFNQGRLRLRELTCQFLATYPGEAGSELNPEQMLITNGSQQGLYLAVQVLCDPGDIIFVERPTYFVFLEMLKSLGVEAISIPTEEDGGINFGQFAAMIEALSVSSKRDRLKAIYLVSYFSNPSSRSMPEEDKSSLGSLLQSLDFNLPVIEDTAYRELYYDVPYPSRSILSLPEYEGISCLYTGTYTKPFATGLKVGFACCSDIEWLKKMERVKGCQDFGTSNFTQAIIESVLSNDLYPEVLNGLRKHYKRKMGVLLDSLDICELRDLGWDWGIPEGGLLCWIKGPVDINTNIDSSFCKSCVDHGVLYVPGSICFADDEPTYHVRLSIGSLDDEHLQEAVKRFVDVVKNYK